MSHFTVLVIGEDVEDQLAPYDEEIQVEPYKVYWDSDTIRSWERTLSEGEDGYSVENGTVLPNPGEATLEEIARVWNARYSAPDEESAMVDDGGIYQMSTYNPKSKWDWYVVGGRWSGFFKLREFSSDTARWHHAHEATLHLSGSEEEAVRVADKFAGRTLAETAFVGRPGVFDNAPRHDVDVVMKGDVDIEWMRDHAGAAAGADWDKVHAVIADLPEARAWEEFVADAIDPETNELRPGEIDKARAAYAEQPRVKAVAEAKLLGFFVGVEEYQVPREVFVKRARDSAIAPFAYVKDGKWYGKGKMRMFGVSDDEMSEEEWSAEFNKLLDELPVDTILTLVDCHI